MAKKKAFLLRIDPDLHDDLRRWADAELRSVNGQIEFVLRQAVRRRKRETPDPDLESESESEETPGEEESAT